MKFRRFHQVAFLLFALTLSIWAIAGEFSKVNPNRAWIFPRDHGAHSEFKNEWWYFTGHVEDREGRKYGFQWTVFRVSLLPIDAAQPSQPSPWRTRELYFGHLALSDLKNRRFYFEEAQSRGALGLAKSSNQNFEVFMPNFEGFSSDGIWRLKARKGSIGLDFSLKAPSSVWLQGEKGYSAKATEQGFASYYYSLPHLPLTGTLQIEGKTISVSGSAWMDHEFGSDKLAPTQIGWDWLSLPFSDGSALMVFRVRDRRGPNFDFYSAAWRDTSGQTRLFKPNAVQWVPLETWKSSSTGGSYPIRWSLKIPEISLDLKINAAFPEQELDIPGATQVIYWEGSIEAKGTLNGKPVETRGYLEMTGYARPFERNL